MARMKGTYTSVSAARSASKSLRTTIPTHIAKQLNLAVKDQLDWSVDKVGGRWVAIIEKVDLGTGGEA